jgi:uncharacterized protein (DUF433 family)
MIRRHIPDSLRRAPTDTSEVLAAYPQLQVADLRAALADGADVT